MKKSILTLFVLFVCAIQTTTAYEYFTIYFSDGTKSEAFYATDVDSICYSKIGLDSIAYDDWQVQEIYTVDSVYRYSLAQIDSLSFKDVDENKVAEDIAIICKIITPIYAKCNSIDEMLPFLPTITDIIGVENAWTDNQSLFVKVRNWGIMTFSYPPVEESEEETICQINRTSSIKEMLSPSDYKACVINQMFNDNSRIRPKNAANKLSQKFKDIGVEYIIENKPLAHFFQNEIFEYDLVFVMTHGYYDGHSHWLYTSEELLSTKDMYEEVDYIKLDTLAYNLLKKRYPNCSPNMLNVGWLSEFREGEKVIVWYITISEHFIAAAGRNYKNKNAAVFNLACQSLKDNAGLANAFLNKGAKCYLGYTESNRIGAEGGESFYNNLLNGKCAYGAKDIIPIEWCTESYKGVTPILELLSKSEKEKYEYRITHPKTLSAEFSSNNGNVTIKMKGNIKILNPYGEEAQNNGYGFQYSESPDMDNSEIVGGELDYDELTHTVTVKYTFKEGELKPNTTYYYRAYMNDGYSNCYGEVKSFYTQVVPVFMSFNNDEDNTYTSVLFCDVEYEQNWSRVEEIAKKYGLNPMKYAGSIPFCDSEGDFHDREGIPVVFLRSSCIIFDPSFANFKPKTTYRWFCSKVVESIKNIQYLNTERLIDMSYMFSGCSSLKSVDLSGLNTSKVTDMRSMFSGCSSLESVNLSSFDTSNVTDMSGMFSGCSSLTSLDLRSFNTSNVTSMGGMFGGCSSLKNLNLSNFDTNNVISFQNMFMSCRKLETIDISNFVISGSNGLSGPIYGIFGGCLSLTKIIFKNGKLKKTLFDRFCFQYYSNQPEIDEFPPLDFDMENLEVSNCGAVIGWGCNNIVSVNLSHLHKVDSIDRPIVSDCSSLKNVNLSYFSAPVLSKITNLFKNCASLESVDMSNMSVPNSEMLGGSGPFDVMFYKCNALSYINLDNLYAPRTECIYFSYFSNSIKNVIICNINAPNLKRMSFRGFSCLERIYVDNTWDNINLDWYGSMFSNCYNLVGGSGTKIGNNIYGYDYHGNPLYYYCDDGSRAAHIDGGKENPGLFTAQ